MSSRKKTICMSLSTRLLGRVDGMIEDLARVGPRVSRTVFVEHALAEYLELCANPEYAPTPPRRRPVTARRGPSVRRRSRPEAA